VRIAVPQKAYLRFVTALFLWVFPLSSVHSSRPDYPLAKQVEVADTLHGVIIPDPYRWLENDSDPEVWKFAEEENKLTRSYLDQIPQRREIEKRITELWNYPKVNAPYKRGNRYFVLKNDGLQNQSVLYVQKDLKNQPEVLIDPNTFSADGTVSMDWWYPSEDGSLIAYGVSSSGTEQSTLIVREVEGKKDRKDTIPGCRFSSVAWTLDNQSFYYTRFPQPGTTPKGEENYNQKVLYHRLGDSPDNDQLIFEYPQKKEMLFGVQLSKDDKYLAIYASVGSSDYNDIYVKDLAAKGDFLHLIQGQKTTYQGEILGDTFYLMTNDGAPFFKVIAINLKQPEEQNWKLLIPEDKDLLQHFEILNHKLVVEYLHNASSLLKVFSLQGKLEHEIGLPAIGSVGELSGKWDSDELFIGFSSFAYPPAIFRYDFKRNALIEFYRTPVKVDVSAYETKQVWYPSKDGTKISMFIVHKKGLKLDGHNPTYLTGYGGFTVSMTPNFSATRLWWLDKGGVFALPNLRGGGEYGEDWHQAGMLDKKQNVYDDFIAAAEYLIQNGYTNPKKLAISGGSNGGLLVGAALVQRPELFKAVICAVPLLDMLRYDKFLIARYWVPEYGSADDSAQFKYLYAYSPYQHIKEGASYPATLFMTGESDSRVHPLHALKMAARMQQAAGGEAPLLLLVETKAGHGQGKPTAKRIENTVDTYSFLTWQLGLP
jgi:prolyl oligopeptidase